MAAAYCCGSQGVIEQNRVRFFASRLERFFLPLKEASLPDALRRQRGFSLPETLLALVLLIATVTALAGYQRGLANGFMQLNQYRQLARCVAIQSA